MSIHVVVMGVAGCGKSTVAEAIHERLGYVYAEGDDFHPQANIDKMSAGIPLTDEDRWPWLKVINTWMVAREALDENTVVSSSALKRSYREVLAQNVPTFFVHLTGSQELIQQRLNERKGHFMPPALLPSQFAILEPLQPDENGVEVSIEGSVEEMVERAVAAAVDDLLLCGPCDGITVPCIHQIGEGSLGSGSGLTGDAPQDHGSLRAGQIRFRFECRCRGAVHQSVVINVLNVRSKPVGVLHIRERANVCRKRKRQHTCDHGNDQKHRHELRANVFHD